MNLDYQQLIPEDFDDQSKVWIYQSNRIFSIAEALEIEDMINDFLPTWSSHGAPVKGYANLFFGQFLVIMADETVSHVGGCSTYESVKVVKEIEQRFNVTMFDRQLLAFLVKDRVQLIPLSQLNYAVENNFIQPDTLYFNNLAKNKEELLNKWLIPVNESWIAAKIKRPV